MKTAKKNGAVTKKKAAPAKKKMGRPTKFSAALGKAICLRITEGESLRTICRDEKMPARASVHLWLLTALEETSSQALKEFSDQYEKSMVVRAENMFDELEEIADDGTNDWVTRKNSNGDDYEAVNTEHIQRSRLRTDVRKWKLSKMLPKRFSDKNVHVTEDTEGNQMPISGNAITFSSQTDNQLTSDGDS